ncbi:imidazole glycerol phosphate synthase subunit HisH [Brachybacterium kimchii]|uniref:Imidazole glycerol phosphate synthase subunit HisH n=1 Tax=Brachybacterium kimchii TaxID=2942909 RepID=A0ABY4N5X7_9MICO|nr:imidazole glycerol phosphate synthase subunit HisH [Brachybacterium kimchii]UQN29961.1 imidazole glycerol phosphate synthase subunit HisH [Brachybacterium kimchii]
MSGSENSLTPQSDAPAPRVVVLDHGSGNVRSAVRALEAAGADVELTADRDRALGADGLVVPGVGAFAATAAQIRAVGGDRIIERRLAGGLPVLGICVGLQVMFAAGTEHGERAAGLDQWPGEITRLEADVVPHMGWNTVEAPQGSRLFAGIEDERFYFVHSYAARAWEFESQPPLPDPLVTWSDHGGDRFVAAVENGALTATQFHPEKSGGAGTRLLRNWLAGLPRLSTRPAAAAEADAGAADAEADADAGAAS